MTDSVSAQRFELASLAPLEEPVRGYFAHAIRTAQLSPPAFG